MHVIPEPAPVDAAPVAPTPDAAIPEAAPTTPMPSTAVRLKIGNLLRPHWKALIFAVLAVVGETAADIAEPWPVKIVVDNLLQSKRMPAWALPIIQMLGDDKIAILNFALGAVLMIAVVGAISSYFEKYLTTTVGQWVSHDLRLLLYQRIQRLSLLEHGESRTGDLISRVTSDIDAIQDFITTALLGIVVQVLTLVGMIGVMFYINWRFTLVALSVAPVLFTVVYFYSRRIKKATRAVRRKESEMLSGVAEILGSIQVVQAFAREDYEERKFNWESRQSVQASLAARSMKAKLSPIVDILVAIGTIMVLGYGARLAMPDRGELSIGVLIVFLTYLKQSYKPMRELSKMTNTISKAAIAFERIQEVMANESRVADLPTSGHAPAFKGQIDFDRVSFSYGADIQILKEVSFHIEPGQVVAIVGPSGTGKTTIASLIPRFFDPQGGAVKIDGIDIKQFTLKSLRDQISFVLQDNLLFSGTVWDNISYGRPDADPMDTIKAAEIAHAHDFIVNMPQGYGTEVGERGVSMSGGQRRRIAIARAIVRNTPILILDEPTTGLDAESEKAVVEALDYLMKGRTCIIIAHHLHTVRNADVIFVMKDAALVEQGTHDELLKKGGVYAHLHELQTTA
jgi:ATP-binding cassette, subfamily B, bacterial